MNERLNYKARNYESTTKIGYKPQNTGTGKEFLDMTPNTRETKIKVDKLDYIKLKSFCTTEETIDRVKRWLTEQHDISANYTPDQGLIPRLSEEPQNLNSQKSNN